MGAPLMIDSHHDSRVNADAYARWLAIAERLGYVRFGAKYHPESDSVFYFFRQDFWFAGNGSMSAVEFEALDDVEIEEYLTLL
jgi:hypothetical protein